MSDSAVNVLPRQRRGPNVRLRVSFMGWFMPLMPVIIGAVLLVTGWRIGPIYLGTSLTTTGTVTATGSSYTDVSFSVDAVVYSVRTTEHGVHGIGETVKVVYNPKNPNQATIDGGRAVALVFAAIGAGLIAASLITVAVVLAVTISRLRKQRRVVAAGWCVDAPIAGVQQNDSVHMGSDVATVVICRWVGPDGVPHEYRSPSRFLPCGLSGAGLPVKTLPVYIDPDNPDQPYYVDDSALSDSQNN